MQTALLMLVQLVQFFLMMAMGFIIVRAGILKPEDSRSLSAVCVYLAVPCTIINAFQIDATDEKLQGFLLAVGAAAAVHVLLLLLTFIMGSRFSAVERASVMYPNAGNLVIPLVTAVLGEEWVLYCSAFTSVQLMLLWTHGRWMLCGKGSLGLKKIFGNLQVITIIIGLFLFLTGIRVPLLVKSAMSAMGTMMGPLAMLVMGMLMAGRDLREDVRNKKLYAVAFFRLIVSPVVILLFFSLTGLGNMLDTAPTLLFITFLAISAPSAATVTQMAQLYTEDGAYAGAINVMTMLLCLFTMPVMTWLYWTVMG